jgi:HD-like signal output (HDOD) protein
MQLTETTPVYRDLTKAATRLPVSAFIFERISTALRKPDFSIDEIVDIISQDPATAVRVLRLANSVQFVRGEPFGNLEQAIDWIGITHIYRLLAVTASANLFSEHLPHYGMTSYQLWHNAVATGTAMNLIAEAGGIDPRLAYTIGLFRPVGHLILQQLASLRHLPLPKNLPFKTQDMLDWEKSCFDVHNAETVAYLFSHWGLHPSMGEAIRHHYTPLQAADSPQAATAALLYIACWMAHEAGYGLPVESNSWILSPEILKQARLPNFNLSPYVYRTKEITARLTVVPSMN